MESDHYFVVAEFHHHAFANNSYVLKQFRYENMWQSHSDYEQLVTESWRSQHRQPCLHGILDSLGALQRQLAPWGLVSLATWLGQSGSCENDCLD